MNNVMQPLSSLCFDTKLPITDRIPEITDVVTPADRIPPFQIQRPWSVHGIADITIEAVYPATGTIINIVALMDAADPLQLFTLTDGTDRILYLQSEALTSDLEGGRFYVKVSDTETTWYSRYMLNVKCGAIVAYPPVEALLTETHISSGL